MDPNSSMELINYSLRRGAKKEPAMAYKPQPAPQMSAPNGITSDM